MNVSLKKIRASLFTRFFSWGWNLGFSPVPHLPLNPPPKMRSAIKLNRASKLWFKYDLRWFHPFSPMLQRRYASKNCQFSGTFQLTNFGSVDVATGLWILLRSCKIKDVHNRGWGLLQTFCWQRELVRYGRPKTLLQKNLRFFENCGVAAWTRGTSFCDFV